MKNLKCKKIILQDNYAKASFREINDREFLIHLNKWKNENILLIYLENSGWKEVCEIVSDNISVPYQVLENMNCEKGIFYIGNLRENNCSARVLKNSSLPVQTIAKADFFDKRTLYADNGAYFILPHYTCEQELAVTWYDMPRKKYWYQILNEIIYSEKIEETLNRQVCIRCKDILGEYVGLYLGDDLGTDQEIEEKCYAYTNIYKTEYGTDMEFCIPEADAEKRYSIVWRYHGQIYTVPAESKAKLTAKLLNIHIKENYSIQIDFQLPIALEKETVRVRLISEKNSWNRNTIRNISDVSWEKVQDAWVLRMHIPARETLDIVDKWKIEIIKQNDTVLKKLSIQIEDMLCQKLNGKEILDYGDTTRKIVLGIEKNCLTLERKYGHNALFKKNCLSMEKQLSLEEFLMRPGSAPQGEMYGIWEQNNDRVCIQLYQNIKGLKEAYLVMYHTQGLGVLGIQKLTVKNGDLKKVKLECPRIDENGRFDKPVNSLWFRVALALHTKNGIFLTFLKNYDLEKKDREGALFDERDMYLKPLTMDSICNIPMSVVPYYAKNNLLSVKYVRPEQLYRSQFCNELLDVSIKKDVLTVKVRCRNCQGTYKGILMEYRKVKEDDAQTYLIPYETLTKESNDTWIMITRIDMKKYYMRMLYWDIRVAFEIGGILYNVACYSNDKKFLKKYDQVFVDRTYPNENSIMFPYATANQSVALMHRETVKQDHWRFRLKEQVAIKLYNMFKNYWNKKNIYLIFEKYCTMAQDNGYFFFKYCMDADVEKEFDGEIYYVLDRKAADWKKVRPYHKHVIRFLSLKHLIYLQACKLMISTDTKGHAYVWRSMGSSIKKLSYKKKLVFLQHGVTAFKRGHFERGTNVGCESFITTSKFEHDIIRNYLGYTEEEVPVTGFARWDVLHDKSEGHREILMMPTWRSWLDDAENDVFAESEYCKNYMALLNDPRLDKILQEKDVRLNFYLHPKFRKFITEFSVVSDRIRLIPFGEAPLNELMMECNLLITDFSSVAWDVYYMNKPVLFYHFDLDEASKTLGFYMDMKNDIFGERAETPEELMQLIIEYVERDFKIKKVYEEQRSKYFPYIDDDNSARIWNAICARDWEQS